MKKKVLFANVILSAAQSVFTVEKPFYFNDCNVRTGTGKLGNLLIDFEEYQSDN